MKKACFTTVIIFIFFAAGGQVVVRTDSIRVAGKKHFTPYSYSRIIGKSQKGTVYALPQDNMSALKPDTTIAYKMPVIPFKQKPAASGYPKQPVPNPLVPKKQKELQRIETPDRPKQIKIH